MNNIIIELCAEDRALLGSIDTKLGELIARQALEARSTAPDPLHEELTAILASAKGQKPQEPAETAPEAPKSTDTLTETHPEEDKPAEAEKTAAPSVTLADIQKKVIQLFAVGGKTKEAARGIVSVHASKVSDLPADKWDEVWTKLNELKMEG